MTNHQTDLIAAKPLEFYFDYLSPYAYFAWKRIELFCADHHLELVIKPVVFGKLLDHWGHLGPAEIPPKREWLIKSCMHYAASNNLPFNLPKYHPFNSLSALRASLKIVSGDHQSNLISAIFDAGWGQGQDIGDTEVIVALAEEAGLQADTLRENISRLEVKDALKENTEEALSRGVFGIPTMIFDDEIFWGNDQFDYLSQIIEGTYQVDRNFADTLIRQPRGIDRKKAT